MAKRHDLTVIVIHHTSKDPSDIWQAAARTASKASRGSTEIRNSVDTLMFVENKRGVSVLSIDKTRSLEETEKPDPLAFQVRRGENDSIVIAAPEGDEVPRKPKLERGKQDIEAILPPDSDEELTFTALMERLPGLKEGAYGQRTAQEALKELIDVSLRRREEGRNSLYRRIKA